MANQKPFFITTPIYYVNDVPHLGSAYTTIAADVQARFYREQKLPVRFLTGTDEHGKKVAEAAAKEGVAPRAFTDRVSAQFKDAWKQLGISFDAFIRTTDPAHVKAVQRYLTALKKTDALYEGVYKGLYCTGCEEYKNPDELVDGLCPIHRTKPEELEENVWFFRLSAYGHKLQELIQEHKLVIEPLARRNEVLQFIASGLKDLAITRSKVEWGIAVPWDPHQTIYVWVDALFNYLTCADGAWPADLHLLGKDILRFHAVIWPALLLALGEPLPRKIFAHGFFTVDGKKMSKSLGNAIDPLVLAKRYGVDALRYFLLREFPFGQDGDFSEEALRRRYEADLQHDLGNLSQRVLTMERNYKVKIAKGAAPRCASADAYTKALAFDRALEEIWKLVSEGNVTVDQEKPWELARRDRAALQKVLLRLHRILETIQRSLEPYLPTTAAALGKQLAGGALKPLFPPLEKQ